MCKWLSFSLGRTCDCTAEAGHVDCHLFDFWYVTGYTVEFGHSVAFGCVTGSGVDCKFDCWCKIGCIVGFE